MGFENLLITGGAGFVGSSLAILFKHAFPAKNVVAVDNLKRRGGELNLARLRAAGVRFVHGDLRCAEDLQALPEFDLLIDCAAEPSVQAGLGESPRYVLNTNLLGTVNCLELARSRQAAFLFLSTSRVYPMAALNGLPFEEDATRFRWSPAPGIPGFSPQGIGEGFTLDGPRSLYGASKLASELLIQEYAFNFGLRAMINRCGILAGPWQMGKVDQGVITLWVAQHHFQRPLRYLGYGGCGKQVRDMLHIEDLFDLLVLQTRWIDTWRAEVYNVGGGPDVSLSLCELTALCQQVTGRRVPLTPVAESSAVDVRIYLSDARKVQNAFAWRPTRGPQQIITDIHRWIAAHETTLKDLLA